MNIVIEALALIGLAVVIFTFLATVRFFLVERRWKKEHVKIKCRTTPVIQKTIKEFTDARSRGLYNYDISVNTRSQTEAETLSRG